MAMIRRTIAAVCIGLALACGGGGTTQQSAVPEGRCEKDADCKADERCAQVAMICEAPPYCGACVAAPH